MVLMWCRLLFLPRRHCVISHNRTVRWIYNSSVLGKEVSHPHSFSHSIVSLSLLLFSLLSPSCLVYNIRLAIGKEVCIENKTQYVGFGIIMTAEVLGALAKDLALGGELLKNNKSMLWHCHYHSGSWVTLFNPIPFMIYRIGKKFANK